MPVEGVLTLQPGVYSVVANWTSTRDRCTRGSPGTDETVVQTTASISGLNSSDARPGATSFSSPTDLLGVTFRFSIIPNQPPPLMVATEFVDCEAVACAGLPTGEYSVQGRRTFCDNDDAGGGWTRIWRLNDSSCESNGWTSGRNTLADGTDPVGCRSGEGGCKRSKDITSSNHSFGEVLGKNWAIWAFGTLESFGTDDGVSVTALQRLWTFSVSHTGANASHFRCPCDPAFSSSDVNIIKRIRDAGNDYICDSAAATRQFSQVFQANGPNICSPRGNDIRFFQKVLSEQQRQWPLQVSICKNIAGDSEDLVVAALDLFARRDRVQQNELPDGNNKHGPNGVVDNDDKHLFQSDSVPLGKHDHSDEHCFIFNERPSTLHFRIDHCFVFVGRSNALEFRFSWCQRRSDCRCGGRVGWRRVLDLCLRNLFCPQVQTQPPGDCCVKRWQAEQQWKLWAVVIYCTKFIRRRTCHTARIRRW